MTGSPPFSSRQLRGAAFAEMLRIIREVEPPKPSTRLSSSAELPGLAAKRQLEPKRLTRFVQGDLDWIVMKCLEKERGRRYDTANQLAQELERFLADEPVLAGPPSAGYRLRKFLRRNKRPVIAVAAVIVALIGGIVGTTIGMFRAVEAEGDAQQQARLKSQALAEKAAAEQDALRHLGVARRRLLATQLARVTLVYERYPQAGLALLEDAEACPPDLRDFAWGVLLPPLQTRAMYATVGRERSPCWGIQVRRKDLCLGYQGWDGKVEERMHRRGETNTGRAPWRYHFGGLLPSG